MGRGAAVSTVSLSVLSLRELTWGEGGASAPPRASGKSVPSKITDDRLTEDLLLATLSSRSASSPRMVPDGRRDSAGGAEAEDALPSDVASNSASRAGESGGVGGAYRCRPSISGRCWLRNVTAKDESWWPFMIPCRMSSQGVGAAEHPSTLAKRVLCQQAPASFSQRWLRITTTPPSPSTTYQLLPGILARIRVWAEKNIIS